MNTALQAVRTGLGALALATGVTAQAAAPIITNVTMVGATPRFGVQSDLGLTNQIQFCTDLSQGWWLALTNVVVVQSPYWFADVAAPPSPQRFYRVRVVGPTLDGTALIPAGSFTMGDCLNDSENGELPLHTVYVSAFYMDTNLVTYSLWTNVYHWATNHGYSFDTPGSCKAANHPVQMVNWHSCVKWCNARSEMGGLIPCYYTDATRTTVHRSGDLHLATNWVNWVANGYRLPTEAEWEKAARGGVAGHRFPWADADTIDWSRANYFASPGGCDVNPTSGYDTNFTSGGYPYTSPVGSFAPNGYGLYDMAGNLFEWCWDWYDNAYYIFSPGTDPHGPVSTGFRVLRCGTWSLGADFSRCAHRDYWGPIVERSIIGFRCVRGL